MTVWRLVACWISKATREQVHACACAHTPTHTHAFAHTHRNIRLTAFPRNSGFVNASQCYVIRTLPV
jgi:hypothetical protein